MIDSVLLIDDDHATNTYHSIVIKRSKLVHRVHSFECARKALDYLDGACNRAGQETNSVPNVIFLDAKMPEMDGLAFLAEYQKLLPLFGKPPLLYLLTVALMPSEENHYRAYDTLKNILHKPLNVGHLELIALQEL